MSYKPIVFISSTSDLVAERAAVATALRPSCEVYLYEEVGGGRASPREQCERAIRRSDVFVILLGPTFGSTVPEDEQGRSIVEWEVDTAMRRPFLEVMPFIKGGRDNVSADPRQQSFLVRIRDFNQGLWCKFFRTPGELVELVNQSVRDWLIRFWPKVVNRRIIRLASRILLPIAVLAVVGVALLQFSPLAEDVVPRTRVVLAVGAGTVVLLSILLLRWAD